MTGGTGYMGSRVIPLLAARGHSVAALVRRGSESKAPPGCRLVVGDALKASTFAAQIGFARVITDRSTFAYLSDVFVLESHRAKGLGKGLMEVIMGHPDLQGLRRWTLGTRDAHGLCRQFGFRPVAMPDRLMEILDVVIYRRESPGSKVQSPKGEGRKLP